LCLIVAAGGFLLASVGRWALGRAIQIDGNQVMAVSRSIADYSLPAGSGQSYASQVADFSMVGYTGDDVQSHSAASIH
jgi:hypothetical protein